MRWAEPWALAALALVPAVLLAWWWLERARRAAVRRAGDEPLVEAMTHAGRGLGRGRRLARAVLLALAMALVALALARPQFGLRTELRKARGMDVVVALDLSRSMLARDVVPSRLARARIELAELIGQLSGDRVGLIGFTSVALPLSPLTVDHAAVKLQLDAATPDDLPRGGTAIGDAIRAGLRMLESAPESGGAQAIVVVTDGEEHEGDPKAAAAEAKAKGVEVHVVGVGSRTGEPIPIEDKNGKITGYVKDGAGRTVVSRLNEAMLRDIAGAGEGLVALPGTQGGLDLSKVRLHLSTLKKAELSDRVVRVYEERYQWFLAPAFLLLLVSVLVRPSRGAAAVALLLALLPRPALAEGPLESEHPLAAAGRLALENGQADIAASLFDKAIDQLGERPDLLYNLGLAEAARGELDTAISRLQQAREAAKDPNLRAKAGFSLGNTYRSLEKYDEAIGAYRGALIDDPKLSGARRNLELTRAMKAVKAAQPKDPNQDGEPDPDQDPPEDQDGGTSDGGGGDGGPPDAGVGDGGDDGDGGGESGDDGGDSEDGGDGDGSSGGADAGSSDDDGGSSGGADGSSGDTPDAGSSGGGDASTGDTGASGSNAAEQPDQEEASVDKQNVEQILDALQEQEEALKRQRLLKKVGKGKVKKDW